MRKIFISLFMLAVVFTANAQKKRELTTPVNVNYCLPKVVYNLEITMECTRDIPGPYHQHAEQELRLKPEITELKERWSIKKIEVKPQYVPDESAIYSISAATEYTPITLALSAEGFLAGVVNGAAPAEFNAMESMTFVADEKQKAQKEIDIVNLNTYNHLKEVLDSNFVFQEIDGEMKKIWDPIIRYVNKTDADNVKEAVSEIFRIRSERVKLLAAENEVPDGKSLEIILKEFNQMEDNYLSLFMGKSETREIKRRITCIPVKADEPTLAFRFSEKEGLVDPKNVTAMGYFLKLANVVVPASNAMNATGETLAVYYRVPAVAQLQLLKGKEELLSWQTIVPQLGETKRFPVDVIANEGLTLEFYPQFGSLKSVQKK